MKLLRGVVLVICVLSGAASRTCPENCQKIPPRSTCKTDTGTCSRGCVAGYYGNMCNLTCDAHCEERTCQQRDSLCVCKPGYTFNDGYCDSHKGVKCESNHHCVNNICLSARRENCLEGCKPGWFGEFCQRSCSSHCNCEEVNGNCTSCIPGWYGEKCGSQCSQGCLNKKCGRMSGICTSCIPGWYGDKCGSQCSPNCVDKMCDTESGICTSCIPGWYGDECGSRCSQGCVDKNCHSNGTCVGSCKKGFYGEKCESTCPEQCYDDQCGKNGTCNTCRPGFYGTFCRQTCHKCTEKVCEMITGECIIGCQRSYYGPGCSKTCQTCIDAVCNGTTGECVRGCEGGYYGSFCNLTCEHCKDGDCVQDTGECRYRDEDGENWSAIGGGIAVVIFILIAVGMFYMFRRLKRVNGVVYDMVKWRRRPPSAVEDARQMVDPRYIELEEEASTNPPRVCPIRPVRETSYIEPQHSGGSASNLQIQRQLQVAGVSDQQDNEQQAAAVSPSHDVQPRSDESHDRPDSYVLPNYCEVDEELMATLPQQPPGAEAPAPVVNNSSFSVVADVHAQHEQRSDGDADLTIPLIAECFGPTETEDSTSDEEPRPNVENYEHPFKNHYTQF